MIKLNLYVVIAEEKYMKYFGTDGFRGEANVNLNVVHAYKVGRFSDGITEESTKRVLFRKRYKKVKLYV
mgnify:CR=1 FL=1